MIWVKQLSPYDKQAMCIRPKEFENYYRGQRVLDFTVGYYEHSDQWVFLVETHGRTLTAVYTPESEEKKIVETTLKAAC